MKKSNQTSLTRRNFFKVGAGVATTVAASHSLAQVCGGVTGDQSLGPFFPRPGTPETPIKENPDPATPIFLSNDNDLTLIKGKNGVAKGQVVYIEGVVSDERCKPIANANVIIWQASSTGRYNHTGDAANHDFEDPRTGEVITRELDPNFQYWGRATTDEKGRYQFKTIVPGFYPADLDGGWYRPPHIHFMISATGFPQKVTQMYFKGEGIADDQWNQQLNQKDYLLQGGNLTEEQRQGLVVEFKEDPSGQLVDGLVGQFDITMAPS